MQSVHAARNEELPSANVLKDGPLANDPEAAVQWRSGRASGRAGSPTPDTRHENAQQVFGISANRPKHETRSIANPRNSTG